MLSDAGNSRSSPKKVIAPGGAISANDVNDPVGTSEFGHNVVQNIELFRIVAAHVVGTVVPEKVVQFADRIRKVDITNPIDHIETFTRVKVMKMKAIPLQTHCMDSYSTAVTLGSAERGAR